ncbi:MAG: 7-carboxy-7-deazaguanine synthase QueE [Gomphosphaeria aponina SAG 52.96 = DSM 107014]|uniref:7-carboxy-7-deazaguanine synthase n=1 Tax=Gomphosphaeria aponina SAG 52.96 = DSM 107014 TaxID=1521640 RepID=A0A941JR86_9CHRO|nr:7-carboxy-7-deazaguanine synthase QueE [Gomphosphaeria aponina SAG 52.96 = DSM 107014]
MVETFHSVQGEGTWCGVNAFFIRLGGCAVHCPWCDQKETWPLKGHPQQNVFKLARAAKIANPAIVIITGGEPLMHDLNPLCGQLRQNGLRVHLETAGAYPFSGVFDWVTFSPKRNKLPHRSIYERVNELKVVVENDEDLQWAEEEGTKVPPTALKYLQPEWHTPQSQELIFNYVLHHPEWRISLQTHKFMGVR